MKMNQFVFQVLTVRCLITFLVSYAELGAFEMAEVINSLCLPYK